MTVHLCSAAMLAPVALLRVSPVEGYAPPREGFSNLLTESHAHRTVRVSSRDSVIGLSRLLAATTRSCHAAYYGRYTRIRYVWFSTVNSKQKKKKIQYQLTRIAASNSDA